MSASNTPRKTTETRQTGISLPVEVFAELDALSELWFTNRSAAIHRIFEDWKRSPAGAMYLKDIKQVLAKTEAPEPVQG